MRHPGRAYRANLARDWRHPCYVVWRWAGCHRSDPEAQFRFTRRIPGSATFRTVTFVEHQDHELCLQLERSSGSGHHFIPLAPRRPQSCHLSSSSHWRPNAPRRSQQSAFADRHRAPHRRRPNDNHRAWRRAAPAQLGIGPRGGNARFDRVNRVAALVEDLQHFGRDLIAAERGHQVDPLDMRPQLE